jgi:multidrug efflux pump subunit AcrB
MSFIAVCCVILFITASLTATILVALAVALVDLYLLALLYYWGLTFNTIVVL